MKKLLLLITVLFCGFLMTECSEKKNAFDVKILFLHHSTGEVIWFGRPPSLIKRGLRKFNRKFAYSIDRKAKVVKLIEKYNKENKKKYFAIDMEFPKISPYGWNNNPFDYYNIWVKNQGTEPYLEEPTLELLTKEYDLIIFKHCYPVSNIKPDKDIADINSNYPSIANYKLQYLALRDKLHQFPDNKFILFTGAAQVKGNISTDEANRAQDFFEWVIKEWDVPDDNIFLWDLYNLETEGGIYFKEEYAGSSSDSHPNKEFANRVSELLFNRIIDIIENNGVKTGNNGERL